MQQVEKNTIPHCIFMEELNMLAKAIEEKYSQHLEERNIKNG